ncbi:MAG: hypothetical protein ABGZ19_12300 [Verrucomicrobiales bacterium]
MKRRGNEELRNQAKDKVMSNISELQKIGKAIKGIFKGKARRVVEESLNALKVEVFHANSMNEEDRSAELKRLLTIAGQQRQAAVAKGANSFGHPEWAAAAACESWLFSLIMDTPEELDIVEMYVAAFIGADSLR